MIGLDDFRRVVSEICKVPLDQIQERSTFRDDLGMDSLSMVNLIVEISERYGLELGMIQSFEDIQTIGNMYRTFFKGAIS